MAFDHPQPFIREELMKTQGYAFGILTAAIIMIGVGCTTNDTSTAPGRVIGGGPSGPGGPATLSAFATLGGGTLLSPDGIQYISGNLWIADGGNNSLQEWATNGTSATNNISSYDAGASVFVNPEGVGLDPVTKNIYVADSGHNQVEVFSPTGTFLSLITANLTLADPMGVAVNSAGTTLYVAGSSTNLVYIFSILAGPSYTPVTTFGAAGTTFIALSNPQKIKLDTNGNVWVADDGNSRLAEYDGSGTYQKSVTAAAGFSPTDMAFDGIGNIYATDTNTNSVVEFNTAGAAITQVGGSILSDPQAITTDGGGTFYVTDSNNSRIIAFH
jgi:DNA-binding beta-propeller fold protein YncE